MFFIEIFLYFAKFVVQNLSAHGRKTEEKETASIRETTLDAGHIHS
jgi:hypothetical protein